MTGGDRAISEQTRGRGRGRGWAALLGHARAGTSARAGHAAGPNWRKEGEAPEKKVFVFLFQKCE
jgi:hypothetical protein